MIGRTQSLKGKKIFITGAASGIGALTAQELASRGASLYLTDINFDELDKVGMWCRWLAEPSGGEVYWSKLDVTDRDAVQLTIDWATERMGGLDIVFANAGIAKPVAIEGGTDVMDLILEVNFKGVRNTINACLPHIRESGGYILANTSMGALVLLALMAQGYGVSKAAVATYAQGTNLHLIGTNARCAALYMAEHDTRMEEEFEHPAVLALFEDNPWLAKAHRKRDPHNAVKRIIRAMETRPLYVHAPPYTVLARWFPAVPNWVVRNCLIRNPQRAISILQEMNPRNFTPK